MDTDFVSLLAKAEGRSEWVIVVVADIRGFSDFSTRNESPNIAMFIRRFYLRLIEDYFSTANFVKPTGDGLLMTFRYTGDNVEAIASTVISACFRCLADFPSLCIGDPMINFPVPTKIGFGVARGTACCLYAGETVLDYSGHLLNLASRLNDIARPAGIVIDGNFQRETLPSETRDLFLDEQVYVRGIADDTPISVMYLKEVVTIPATALSPVSIERWELITKQLSYRTILKLSSKYRFFLPHRLKAKDKLKVTAISPKRGLKGTFNLHEMTPHVSYLEEGAAPELWLNLTELRKKLAESKTPQNATVSFRIEFVARK